MLIAVESKRRKPESIQAAHPGRVVLDVTSKGPQPWVRFSPFFRTAASRCRSAPGW